MEDSTDARPRFGPGKKLLFTLVALTILYIPAEIIHRAVANRRYQKVLARMEPCYLEHDRLGWVFRPGDWSTTTQGTGVPFDFHINAKGLRGPELEDLDDEDAYRILCIGGSTTFATGCPVDTGTYPAQLEARLRKRNDGRRYQVLNAGVPGYRTAESLLNLTRLRELAPHMVIIYHGINDITWGMNTEYYADPEQHERPLGRLQRLRERAGSFLVQEIWRRLFDPYPPKPDGAGAAAFPEARAAFEGNLTRMVEVTREMGAVPVLMTFGTRLRKDLAEADRESIQEEPSFQISYDHFDGMLGALEAYNASIRAVAARTKATLIELEGAVPSDAGLWSDFCHLDEEGTTRMIDALLPQLEPALGRKSP